RGDVAADPAAVPAVAAIVDRRVYIAREDLGVAVIEMRSPPGLPPPPFRNRVTTYRAVMPGTASFIGPQFDRLDQSSFLAETVAEGQGAIVHLDDVPAPSADHIVN